MSAADGRAPAAAGLSGATDAELRSFVDASLGAATDEIVRRPLAQSTSFACELLDVRLNGRALALFFKDFGSTRLAREGDDGARREIEVYRRLDAQALGTAWHFGSRFDARGKWLLLERVNGGRLAKAPGAWRAAVEWLARLQASAASHAAVLGADALVVHDAAHFHATARAAVAAATEVDASFEHGLLKALEDYEAFVERVAELPRTLVHGSYRPENILVDEGARPARIAPVDWEHAAAGCALYDLAFLTANLATERARELLALFRAAAAGHGLDVPDADDAWRLVRTLRLHKFLRSLGRAVAWSYPRDTVARLVELVRRDCAELRDESHSRGSAELPSGTRELAHPALRAWRALGLELAAPPRVERIEGRFFGRKGRVVYRLGPIGPQGSAVVAKRCPREVGALEARVYRELLPELGPTAPRCDGWLADGSSSWLFVEDVGTRRLAEIEVAERASALAWLGRLHGASARLPAARSFPERGAQRHRQLLREALSVIESNLANPALTTDDRAALRVVIATGERVDAVWERLAATCAAMPAVFAHGDFRPKNLYLRERAGELVLFPIDWEYSGWSVPAADLGSLLRERGEPGELSGYLAAIEPFVPGLRERDVWRWVIAGRALRAITSIHWTRNSVAHPSVQKPVGNLRLYRSALEQAFEQLAAAELAGGGRS